MNWLLGIMRLMQASNLSELSLTLGDVSSAVRQGEQSVELADRSGDAFQRMVNRTTLADALRCASGTRSVKRASALGVKKGSGLIDAKHPSGTFRSIRPDPFFTRPRCLPKRPRRCTRRCSRSIPSSTRCRATSYCELLLEQCRASRGLARRVGIAHH